LIKSLRLLLEYGKDGVGRAAALERGRERMVNENCSRPFLVLGQSGMEERLEVTGGLGGWQSRRRPAC